MFKKYIYIIVAVLAFVSQANGQFRPTGSGSARQMGGQQRSDVNPGNSEDEDQSEEKKDKPSVPSIIRVWELADQGSLIKSSELDTTLWFYHNYLPFNQRSISSTFTGNNGGAYLSNDYFSRKPNSDFYFARSFDAYWLTPGQIKYFNTTTPYTLLDYSQSENRMTNNETRFNVTHSQNVNKNLNFGLVYNQTRSDGQYLNQKNKFHNIALFSSYLSDQFVSHSNIIFNRTQTQENGGIEPNQNFDNYTTDEITVRITDNAFNKLKNNNFFTTNEYRLGKTIESEPDTAGFITETFIPRVGFIYQGEYSANRKSFTMDNAGSYYPYYYMNDASTSDSVSYSRLTNLFQIKFYEAPDRKYTFGKRAYIGHDILRFHSSTEYYHMAVRNYGTPEKFTNTYVGGGIFRDEGKFWQWAAEGRIYLAGLKAGQTELQGFVNKPLKIGKDTTSLRIEGSLKTIVPEYFDEYFYSNHFQWRNNFDNINEMTVRSSIRSQEYKTTIGANYSLIGNYIYNGADTLPAQTSTELVILSAYLNKDFDRKHWLVRTQLLVQKVSNDKYLHLPAFAGFASLNYRTLVSKVLYTQLGVDARYNSAFYADAYDPATTRFYLQNEKRIGNFPYIDLHVNLKLKRTRVFFVLLNAASGLAGNNYFVAPDHPYFRRTYRIGVAWSFYD